MLSKGDVMENPITKERVIFQETHSSTNGELLRMEVFNLTNGFNNIYHIHPTQVERHEIIDGIMGVKVNGEERILRTSESVTFEKNIPHKFWNVSGADIHFLTEFRPAYDTESFIETYFRISQAGKANKKGQPPPFHFFVLLNRYPIAGYFAGVPISLQKVLISIMAFVGRLLGYKPTEG